MAKPRRGLMYKIIHDRLKVSIIGNELIPKKQLFEIFGRVYHIPPVSKHIVMKELLELNMISFENRKIKINP